MDIETETLRFQLQQREAAYEKLMEICVKTREELSGQKTKAAALWETLHSVAPVLERCAELLFDPLAHPQCEWHRTHTLAMTMAREIRETLEWEYKGDDPRTPL